MNKSKSLIFFGNERLSSGFSPNGAPVLEALIKNGYDIKAVVANYEAGQSRKSRQLEIEAVANKHNIPVLLPKKPAEILDRLKSYQAEIGVLVAYGRIIPQSVIDIFPCGILNIHPSLLPKYRGATPIEQAILDGAGETGVSIMGLVKEMDAGPIYAQQKVKLTGQENKIELTEELLQIGSRLILDVLPSALDGTAKTRPQGQQQATFTKLINKTDGDIDLSKSAQQYEREVRAYAIWPKSRLCLNERQIIVTQARVVNAELEDSLIVTCNPGYLEILELIAPSGKKMSGDSYIRGYLRN